MNETIRVLHPGIEAPTGQASAAGSGVTSPPGSITLPRGLRVALLDNTKINADNLLWAISRRLQEHGIAAVQMWRKRHAGESGAAAIAELRGWKPDLVLTGLGD
jgi:hypothetical protein